MNSSTAAILTLVLTGLLQSSCTRWSIAERDSGGSTDVAELCDRLHEQINDYRITQQLQPLERHPGLDQLALDHCRYLSMRRPLSFLSGQNVSHSGANGRSRTAGSALGMVRYGENVAAISSDPACIPEHLVFMWKTSRPHHVAMRGDWTHAGVAMVFDRDGMIFATQVFAAKAPEPTP